MRREQPVVVAAARLGPSKVVAAVAVVPLGPPVAAVVRIAQPAVAVASGVRQRVAAEQTVLPLAACWAWR